MHSFFCPSKDINNGFAKVTDKKDVHHILRVARIKSSEEVLIFDENNRRYRSKIISSCQESISFEILSPWEMNSRFRINLTIACAIPKNSRMDDLIDKLTQLGVDRIIPLLTDRTVVKLNEKKEKARNQRWSKIMLSAVQQSNSLITPIIDPVTDYDYLVKNSNSFELRLIPYLDGSRRSIKEVLSESDYKNVLVVIGPEGDFSPREIKKALANGFKAVSLGPNILRVETAAVSVAAFIRFSDVLITGVK